MGKSNCGAYLGHYIYAKQLANGEWSLYEGHWGNAPHSTTGLEVMRSGGKPIRFASLKDAKEYFAFRFGQVKRR